MFRYVKLCPKVVMTWVLLDCPDIYTIYCLISLFLQQESMEIWMTPLKCVVRSQFGAMGSEAEFQLQCYIKK